MPIRIQDQPTCSQIVSLSVFCFFVGAMNLFFLTENQMWQGRAHLPGNERAEACCETSSHLGCNGKAIILIHAFQAM